MEWKISLKRTFSRQHDFAVYLEEVGRRKLADESMTRYFHAKLAVACIIKGISEELRANAYACRCDT